MKAKKIVALMIGVVSLVGISVPAKAETYAPVDSASDSSRYLLRLIRLTEVAFHIRVMQGEEQDLCHFPAIPLMEIYL